MFKMSETADQGDGTWTPVPEGDYDVEIVTAAWREARTGTMGLALKCQVKDAPQGCSATFFDDLYITKASGQPIEYGRKRAKALAIRCDAETNDEPDPKKMVGKVVRMTLVVQPDGRGVDRNRIEKIVMPQVRSDPGASADAYREASGGRAAPPADFDDDIPF